ncbi:hypothetical protein [Vibrio splendidus]|uniref:hypothetical protein n=1 Tax=Vibrio splendidus TaxID=29497 RepID=UPI00352FD1A9
MVPHLVQVTLTAPENLEAKRYRKEPSKKNLLSYDGSQIGWTQKTASRSSAKSSRHVLTLQSYELIREVG